MSDPDRLIARAEARSNVFLAALIDGPGGPVPVRVRNLSPRGALLEGPVLPLGGEIRLRRGNLHVRGKVAWLRDSYCGLRFDSTINVQQWLERIGHQGQDRVDRILASIRTGGTPVAVDPVAPQGPVQIAAALLEIAERLSAIDGLSVEAGEELLKIDTLARIIETWGAQASAA